MMKRIFTIVFFLGFSMDLTQAAQRETGKDCQAHCGCRPCGCEFIRCDQQEKDYFSATVPIPATKSTDDATIAK